MASDVNTWPGHFGDAVLPAKARYDQGTPNQVP